MGRKLSYCGGVLIGYLVASFAISKRNKTSCILKNFKLTFRAVLTVRKIKEIKLVAEKLKQSMGRAATTTEIANAMGMEKEKIEQLLAEEMQVGSIYDKKGGSDESVEIIDTIQDENSQNPLEQLVDKDIKKELQMALKRLPERERMIMVLYYHENMTLKEIGETINVSESRVCQLHAQAIMKLKNILSATRSNRMRQSIV